MAEMERAEAIARVKEIVGYVAAFIFFIIGSGGLIYMAIFLKDL